MSINFLFLFVILLQIIVDQLSGTSYTSEWARAFLFDLVGLGMMETIQELCYITFIHSRYQLLFRHDPIWKKYFIFFSLFLVLFCTWVPFYTFVPAFIDVNKPRTNQIIQGLYEFGYLPGFFLYNAYFTGMFVLAIRRLLRNESRDGRLLLMARKCVIHSTIRCY